MPAEWEEFEEQVRQVYNTLLNLKDEGTVVARNVKMKGRDGIPHQFDVFYQFTRGGLTHGVAIECKNTRRPVEKNDVMAFKSKIDDVPGLRGLVVAKKGFQQGARIYAEKNGVDAIEASELPGVGELLAARLESVALPDENMIGEPFWAIFEIRDGKNTGSALGNLEEDIKTGFLFFSKPSAQRYVNAMPPSEHKKWAVRGLPQRCLRTFILIIDAFNGLPTIVSQRNADGSVEGLVYNRKLFLDEFYVGKTPIPAEPLAKPGCERK